MARFLTRDEWHIIRPALLAVVIGAVFVSLLFGWVAAAIMAIGLTLLGGAIVVIETMAGSDA